MIQWVQSNWIGIVAGYLLFIKVITAVRDALDTTPDNDVNWFEKAVTMLNKLSGSLIAGKRIK